MTNHNNPIDKVPQSAIGALYTPEDIDTVVNVMKNASTLTQGRYLEGFEKNFSAYNGSSNCFAVSSCTAALELAAALCQLKPNDEVILPAHTFCATAIPFARTGAKLVWADIDLKTRNISPETVRPLITRKTKVIIAVHLYGLMAPMKELMDLAKKHHVLVVEDCAQSPGSSIEGVKAGNFGDFACFSFHTAKNISTLGEGGMLVVKSDELAKFVPGLRHNGLRSFNEQREHYWIPAMSNVDSDIDGIWPYNFCIGEAQCALGSKLLERLDTMNEDRNRRAEKIIQALQSYPEMIFQEVPDGYYHCYHLLSVMYNGEKWGKTNHDFIKLMFYTYKVKMIVQYYPLYRYPLFIKAGFGSANCPNTDRFFDQMVSYPFHHWLSDRDVDYMIDCTRKTLKKLRGRGVFKMADPSS